LFNNIRNVVYEKWADFNNDNYPDLLVAKSGNLELFINNGDETFTEQANSFKFSRKGFDFGDYNNDNFLDIIITNEDGSLIYKNNGDATFTEQTQINIIGVGAGRVAFGDYNNDNFLDFVISGKDVNDNFVSKLYKNNGDETFTQQSQISLPDVIVKDIVFSDINNDNFLDIIFSDSTYLFINDKNDNFVKMNYELTDLKNSTQTFADFDKNGKQDIFISGKNQNNNIISKLYFNEFGNAININSNIIGLEFGSAEAIDYNNDGYSDLIVCGKTSSGLPVTNIYRNGANGAFANTGIYVQALYGGNINSEDYNNDGLYDFIICGKDVSDNYQTKVYKNKNGNIFEETTILLLPAKKAVFTDFNNDNLFDIILLDKNDKIRIYKNTGNNNFELLVENYGSSFSAYDFAITDYDADGKNDIAIYEKEPSRLFYLVNQGNFNFSSTICFLYSVNDFNLKNSLFVADYDNDGLNDMLINGGASDTSATFIRHDFSIMYNNYKVKGTVNGHASFCDWNDDGLLDYIETGKTAEDSTWTKMYINNCETINTPPGIPSNLNFSCNADTVFISWLPAPDDDATPQAGLTYNCYMYEVGGDTIWHSIANQGLGEDNGKRYITKSGNVGHNTSWFINGLDIGKKYAWTVQAIDNGFMGGHFAPEDTFMLAPAFVIQPINQTVCENGNITFNTSTTPAINYQWCIFTATDTIEIVNEAPYSNSTTPNLTISFASLDMQGYEFHCKATTVGGDTYSDAAILSVDEFEAANAGADSSFCETSIIAYANMPVNSSGTWVCNDANVIISDVNSNTASISNLPEGNTSLTWKITQTNVCGTNSDEIIFTSEQSVSQASQPTGETNCVSGILEYQTNQIYNATSYIWELLPAEAGVLIGNTYFATINWSNDFVGEATLRVAGKNNCSDINWSNPLSITVTGTPEQADIPTGETEICKGTASTNLTTNSVTGATSYEWEIIPQTAGAISGTGTTVILLWNTSFSGDVKIKVRAISCEAGEWSDETNIKVYETIPESLNTPTGISELCKNPNNTFYNVLINQNSSSYVWELSNTAGSIIQTENNVEIDWDNSFTETAELKVKGVNVCGVGTWSNGFNISIYDNPSQASVPEGKTELCVNQNSTYLTTTVPYATSYLWKIYPSDAGNISSSNFQITTSWEDDFSGIAYIKVKAKNQCGEGDFSDSLKITLSSPTVSEIISKSSTMLICVDSGYTYKWYLNDEIIEGANKQFYYNKNLALGEYKVEISDKKECKAYSDVLIIGNLNKSKSLTETINIYPNPTTGKINIEIDNDFTGEIKYLITDNLGRVKKENIIKKDKEFLIINKNLSGLNTGIYRIDFIFNNNEKVSKQLIIK